MPTRNVNPTEYFNRFTEVGVTSGSFSSASGGLKAALFPC